jgi:hypothetical protein
MYGNFVQPLERRALLAGTIGGVVFDDLNGNGVREAGEPGLAGQRVFIDADFDGVLGKAERSQFSNSSGAYAFTNLPNGVTRVRLEPSATRRLSAPAAVFYDVPITFDTNATGRDFGNTTTAVIRGSVFSDLNGDAQRQTGERGLAGWTVFLDKDNDGRVDSNEKVRVTNSRGEYRFAGLTPGTYFVRIVQQNGVRRTNPLSGRWTITVGVAQSFSNRNFGQIPIGDERP